MPPPRSRGAVAAALVVSTSLLLGCVTRGTHQEVVGERDQLSTQNAKLESRVRALEASTAALSTELDTTLEQYEDLAINHDTLVMQVEKLRQTEKSLATKLTAQSVELVRSQEQLEVTRSELQRLTSTYTTLMSDLESEVAAGQIQIEQLREGIRVNVSDDILFASGSAKLDPVGQQVLDKVAAQLAALDHEIEVQGHTDDRKIRGGLKARYPTNWELAAARAARVVRLLQQAGISGDRLSLVSFASFKPIAPNDSDEDRSLNRRIEIRLKPKDRPALGTVAGGGTAGSDDAAPVAAAGTGAGEPAAASTEP